MNQTSHNIFGLIQITINSHQSRKIFKPERMFVILAVIMVMIFSSCEEFKDPEQPLILKSNEMFENWEEYRSAEMGLYALQQNLVEQLVILGELRGDLLKITKDAPPELNEIYNFRISKDNPYASPVNFYKLISATNKLIRQLEIEFPDVMDSSQPINNYDRLYGEALCMRAWAYFNAVRIYGEVPYIHESLDNVNEIKQYVNSGGQYVDSVYIKFVPDGYYNDTIRDTTIVLDKKLLNQKIVIDSFTYQLENNVKAVGVDHSINNNDRTWMATVWNENAYHVLLGQMYLFDGNYFKAMEHFDYILYNYSSQTNHIRFGLDDRFEKNNWKNIFQGIDTYEHIFTLWFGHSFNQEHQLQYMFSNLPPNLYLMKPTSICIRNWESMWEDPQLEVYNDKPENTWVRDPGIPGDFYRGYGVSYLYYKNGVALSEDAIRAMLKDKMQGDMIDVQTLMRDVDTVVNKYSIGKDEYANDADFIIYRAAGVHLYAAEIYALWELNYSGIIRPETNTSLNILNRGNYSNRAGQLGVRGRVGFADGHEAISIEDIIYQHDPHTNRITGYLDYTGNLDKKQKFLIDRIMEERARELAFEGERFYDLMRVARRRNDPDYLARRVAEKFSGDRKTAIRSLLQNPENWYINYFD